MVDLVVRNGLVVTPGGVVRGGLAIDGERIAAVGADTTLPQARRVIDAREQWVIPGLIDAHVNMGSEERDTVIGGRYLDRLDKRAGEWRIAHRVMLYDWFQDFGVSADWSQGVMGLPFSAGHYTGRAVGDYSKVFFSTASSLR